LPGADVAAALQGWVQAGRAVFDLPAGRYAWRELSREPLPLDHLRFASPEEAQALEFVKKRLARVDEVAPRGAGLTVGGSVKEGGREYQQRLVLDADERLQDGQCTCNFFQQNKLRRGPCAHMLAVRQLAQPQIDAARDARVTAPQESA
jgi:hypothetical protein